jgi:cytochrome c biogenesis protein CcmG/thiol:disulfide interchange protein DsbE
MSSIAAKCRNGAAAALATAVVALAAGCGGGESDTVDPGSANPDSAVTLDEAQAPVKNAAPELAALRDDANEILDEGTEGYEGRIAELEGTPVVVNNWASWCGPCREEIPFFQEEAIERGDEVAFVGLLSGDGPETGATFLTEFPLPYPSYLDPDFDESIDIGTGKRLPSTAFYDSSGELVYLRSGPYGSADELAADIEEYAN